LSRAAETITVNRDVPHLLTLATLIQTRAIRSDFATNSTIVPAKKPSWLERDAGARSVGITERAFIKRPRGDLAVSIPRTGPASIKAVRFWERTIENKFRKGDIYINANDLNL